MGHQRSVDALANVQTRRKLSVLLFDLLELPFERGHGIAAHGVTLDVSADMRAIGLSILRLLKRKSKFS